MINLIHYFEPPRHINNAFLSNFFAIYDRVLYFWGRNGLLRDCSKNQVYLLSVGNVECSSMVEHSTADGEVGWFNSARCLLHYSGLLVERL